MTEVYESFTEIKVNGREILLVDKEGYTYKRARGKSGAKVTHACTEVAERDCPCKISVLSNKVVWRTTTHNHMPNEYNLDAKVTMSRLWHAATESDCDIRELVTNTLPLLSPNVCLYMPEAERLRANLQAARRAANKKRDGQPPTNRKQPAAAKKRKAEDENDNLAQLEKTAGVSDALQTLAQDFTELIEDEPKVESSDIQEEMSPPEQQQINRELFPEGLPPAVKKLRMVSTEPDSTSP